jgi:hypothetical protein
MSIISGAFFFLGWGGGGAGSEQPMQYLPQAHLARQSLLVSYQFEIACLLRCKRVEVGERSYKFSRSMDHSYKVALTNCLAPPTFICSFAFATKH